MTKELLKLEGNSQIDKNDKKDYTLIDLFAGAESKSEGFGRARFSPFTHIEMDKYPFEPLKTRAAHYYLEI